MFALVVTLGSATLHQDVGPAPDVHAVRQIVLHEFHLCSRCYKRVERVRVVDHLAVAWSAVFEVPPSPNDGEVYTTILERAKDRWRVMVSGGGLVCPKDMTQYMTLQTAGKLLGPSQIRECTRFGD